MMTQADCDSEMLAGYWDGLMGGPEPGGNRSHSYRHGWKNGRDDRGRSPRESAGYIREEAANAMAADKASAW